MIKDEAKAAGTSEKGTRYIASCNMCDMHTSALAGDRLSPVLAPYPPGIVFLHPRMMDARIACRGCGKARRALRVKGKVTEEQCNPKCLSAHGPSCSCSCGGENHGASFQGATS
jgi:hypothetical protein